MQGEKGNIKVNLGFALLYQLFGCIIVFCLLNDMALYNIPIGFKIFPLIDLLHRKDTFTNIHKTAMLHIATLQWPEGSKGYPLQTLGCTMFQLQKRHCTHVTVTGVNFKGAAMHKNACAVIMLDNI